MTKDGHTMFFEDIEKDLKRKSFLECENETLRTEKAELLEALKELIGYEWMIEQNWSTSEDRIVCVIKCVNIINRLSGNES